VVENREGSLLRRCLESVRVQDRPDWEHVVVATDVPSELTWDARTRLVPRPKGADGGAAYALALSAARSPWLALLPPHDAATPDVARRVLKAASGADVVYTDRAETDAEAATTTVFRKPDWSPLRLLGDNYLDGLVALRCSAVEAVGGFGRGCVAAAAYDAVLRVCTSGTQVRHVRAAGVVRTRGSQEAPTKQFVEVVQAHLERTGREATAVPAEVPGFVRLRRPVPPGTTASVIVPTRGTRAHVFGRERVLVEQAIESIVEHVYTTDYEIVLVIDGDARSAPYLDRCRKLAGHRLRVVEYSEPFNFSRKTNLGVLASSGDVVVMLNDDISVITPTWLDDIVALALEPEVGEVGVLLRYEDGSVQHGGHIYQGGRARHAYRGANTSTGDHGDLVVDREVSGVTAACAALRRVVYEEVGGLTEHLPNSWNDVDLSLKVRSLGFSVVLAAGIELHHVESATRSPHITAAERRFLHGRWLHMMQHEAFTRAESA